MPRPSANVNLTNGNLGGQAPSNFGVTGITIASPAAPAAGYGVPFLIKSPKQAETAFAQPANAGVLEAIKEGFFAEGPIGSKVYIICIANTNTLDALAGVNVAPKILSMANGQLRAMAAIKFPDVSYVPDVDQGFDADVHDAVGDFQTLADTWLADRKPFRFLIQGYGATNATAAKDYSEDVKRNGAIVVGAVNDNSAISTLLALGRIAQGQSQRNIGRVKSGSLKIDDDAVVKVGSTVIESVESVDLDTYYDKRYITFDRNESAPGYIFTDDITLTSPTDDYCTLSRGLVIDNAVRIAYATYYKELKDDVDVDSNGRLASVVEKALENEIENNIDAQMRSQLSKKTDGSKTANVKALVNPDTTTYNDIYEANEIDSPNLNMNTNGGLVYVFLSLLPKGVLKTINIFLGYTANQ